MKMGAKELCSRFRIDYVQKLIAAYYAEKDTLMIDAGAHVGKYAVYYANLVGPHGRVYAYEPNPCIFARLSETVQNYGQIVPKHRAVSSESNKQLELQFYPDRVDYEGSTVVDSLKNAQRMPGESSKVDVLTEKLDELLEEPFRCSFIKIDVEGHEDAVLEGAKELIVRDRPFIIYEYGFLPGIFEPRTIRTLKDLGYSSYDTKTKQKVEDQYAAEASTDLIAVPLEKEGEFQELISIL